MIAALFVETGGVYFDLPGVDPWDEARNARMYAGPHPIVAHPPCQRWGRFWHGSTRKPHQFKKGDDGGCFAAALEAVRRFGGVLEHPADSHAWPHFGIRRPPRDGGWVDAGFGWTCEVSQGHYGHLSGKPTWLLANVIQRPPELRWGRCPQRLHPVALARHGYEKARRIGMVAMVGQGQDAHPQRDAARIPGRSAVNRTHPQAGRRRIVSTTPDLPPLSEHLISWGIRLEVEAYARTHADDCIRALQIDVGKTQEALRSALGEIAGLRQALWDCYAACGADTDGDATPASVGGDLGALVLDAMREARKDYNDALDANSVALARAEKAEARAGSVPAGRLIGYTSQFDLDFPFAYPNLGGESGERNIPVYVASASSTPPDGEAS